MENYGDEEDDQDEKADDEQGREHAGHPLIVVPLLRGGSDSWGHRDTGVSGGTEGRIGAQTWKYSSRGGGETVLSVAHRSDFTYRELWEHRVSKRRIDRSILRPHR